jgi:hypothetical protein
MDGIKVILTMLRDRAGFTRVLKKNQTATPADAIHKL